MASVNDKITDTRNSARPVSTTVSSARSPGGTTLACASLTGWATDSKVHFVTYQIDSNSDVVAGTQLDCYGIVSGNNINSFTVVDGTDNGNSTGDIVEMLPTSAWGQDLADGLTQEHNRDGTHSDITADTVSTDTINEGTADTGVTIDGLLIKDSKLAEDNSVVTANITNSAVTPAKRSGGFYVGNFIISASGSQSITGVGFTPKMIMTEILDGGDQSVSNFTYGTGATDGTRSWVHAGNVTEGSDASGTFSESIFIGDGDPNAGFDTYATLTSFDADGFTINVVQFELAIRVGYICFG